jgi:hypothetical protein
MSDRAACIIESVMEISEESTVNKITVCSVYSLPMGKISIHLKGGKDAVVLYGNKVEKNADKGQLVVYDFRDKIIAEFAASEVAGWSIDKD